MGLFLGKQHIIPQSDSLIENKLEHKHNSRIRENDENKNDWIVFHVEMKLNVFFIRAYQNRGQDSIEVIGYHQSTW